MKKLINKYLLVFITIFTLTSCEKDEVAIKLPPRGNSTFMVLENLGKDFEKQAFFNLKDSQVTLVNSNCWDLAFDASPIGINITLNGGMDMYAAKTEFKKFLKTNNPDTFNYKWDAPCGCYDSLAIYNWIQNLGKVYILDRGANYTTDRYIQLLFNKPPTQNKYFFHYASLDNPTEIYDVEVPKDPSKVNVYYSFTTKNVLNFEPRKEKWDLCFLKYRLVFFETTPITKYVVRGIFINQTKIIVSVDSTTKFDIITPSYANNYCKYANNRDVIGYDWKIYNFTTGQYVARTYVNYIIKSLREEETYKLRFLDFNNNGIKGTPKFEYLKLE